MQAVGKKKAFFFSPTIQFLQQLERHLQSRLVLLVETIKTNVALNDTASPELAKPGTQLGML